MSMKLRDNDDQWMMGQQFRGSGLDECRMNN